MVEVQKYHHRQGKHDPQSSPRLVEKPNPS
jgi:hypothetical protein